jgi:hypothetical protein
VWWVRGNVAIGERERELLLVSRVIEGEICIKIICIVINCCMDFNIRTYQTFDKLLKMVDGLWPKQFCLAVTDYAVFPPQFGP